MATNKEKKLATARATVEELVSGLPSRLVDADVSEGSQDPFVQEGNILQTASESEIVDDINTAIATFNTNIDKLFNELTITKEEAAAAAVETAANEAEALSLLTAARERATSAVEDANRVQPSTSTPASVAAITVIYNGTESLVTLTATDDTDAINQATDEFIDNVAKALDTLKLETEVGVNDSSAPVENTYSVAVNILLDIFNNYVAVMAPSCRQTEDSIVKEQTKLYHGIMSMLNLEGKDFSITMNVLLDLVEKNKKLSFSPYVLYRGFDQLKLNRDQRRFFERILNLFTTTSNSSTRTTTKKQVDIAATLEGVHDEAMSQKVMAFYAQ